MDKDKAKSIVFSAFLVTCGIVVSYFIGPVLWSWFLVPLGAPAVTAATLLGAQLAVNFVFLYRPEERKLAWSFEGNLTTEDLRWFRKVGKVAVYRPFTALILGAWLHACCT